MASAPSSARTAVDGQTAGASAAPSGGGASRLDGGSLTSACSAPASCVLMRGGYMRSGAVTPSSPSPLPSTTRVASHSASRAYVSGPTSSSPCGSTRHAS